jgi:tetratricopeptide (TPR) repeat protein
MEVRDLEGERDALVLQLHELEDTASKRTPAQLTRERYALEIHAARVLLALDEQRPAAAGMPAATKNGVGTKGAATPPAAAGVPSVRAARDGFLWGASVAATLFLLVLFVQRSVRPREAGGSVTGDGPRGGMGADAVAASGEPADREEAQIRAALARDPNDIDAHLALARVHLRRHDAIGLWKETRLVLERSPGNPQALAYQALVRLALGETNVALDMLKQAVATDPNLVDGYVNMALVYVRMGRARDAEAAIAEASKRFPDQADGLKRLLVELQRPASRRVSGTVDIDRTLLRTVNPGAVLFVFVREAGFGAGPPIAAKRLAATFPAIFEITGADAMMDQAFPDSLLVEARLDSDGDPTTRSPSDPKARLEEVKAGRTDVRLVLTRQ